MLLNLNSYKSLKKFSLLCFVSLLSINTYSQNIADKEYYLIDDLVLNDLSSYDIKIIDSCLAVYHGTNKDLEKIEALSHICDNIANERWIKYQEYQHHFIVTKSEQTTNEKENNELKPYLASSLSNLALIELGNDHFSKAADYYKQSLKISTEIADSSGIAHSYSGIAYMYQHQGKSREAIDYNNKSLLIYKKLGDELSMANNLQNLAEINDLLGNTFIALSLFERAIKIYEKYNDPIGKASSYNNLALLKTSIGNIPEAINLYTKSIAIFEEIGYNKSVAIANNNIGDLYFKQEEEDKALESYFKSLEIYKKIDSKLDNSISLRRIGKVFLYTNEFDSALLYFNKSLEIDLENKNTIGLAEVFVEIGNLYSRKGELEESIQQYKKALTLYKEIEYIKEITICKVKLAETYKKKGAEKIAETYAISAFENAKELGYPKQIQDASIILSEIAKEKGDFKKGLEMYALHIQMRDSLINLDNKALLIRKDLETEYNEKTFNLKEQKLLDGIKLKEQSQKIVERTYLAILIFFLLVIIALFALWRSSKYKLNIKWLQEDVLKSQMKPHFLFNVLVSIQSLIVQKKDKVAIHYLAEIASYMRSNLSDVSLKSIPIEKELQLAEQYLDLEKLRFKEKLDFEIINALSGKDKLIKVPPLITQPIIENSIIHGFKDIDYVGKVTIRCEIVDENLHILIEDNGKGFDNKKKNKSKGLDIVRKRLKLFSSKNKLVIKNKENVTSVEVVISLK